MQELSYKGTDVTTSYPYIGKKGGYPFHGDNETDSIENLLNYRTGEISTAPNSFEYNRSNESTDIAETPEKVENYLYTVEYEKYDYANGEEHFEKLR